jgi:hypothetical protein
MRDRLNNFQFHDLFGQQAQRPALLALGRCATGQCNQSCFRSSIQASFIASCAGLGQQRCQQALLNKALPHAFDGALAQIQRLGYLFVRAPGPCF